MFGSVSDRAADRWREDYAIAGVEGLDLHHFYPAMAWLLDDSAPFPPLLISKRRNGIEYEAKTVMLAGRGYMVCRNHQGRRRRPLLDRGRAWIAIAVLISFSHRIGRFRRSKPHVSSAIRRSILSTVCMSWFRTSPRCCTATVWWRPARISKTSSTSSECRIRSTRC